MTQQNQASSAKYRPVLTGQMISHLIALCKREGSRDSLACLSQLCLYEYKIQNELTKPAYVEKGRENLASSLGFDEPKNPDAEPIEINTEALYNLWLVKPESLTVHQIQMVQQFRYENNKMTVDEEKKFETEVLGLA